MSEQAGDGFVEHMAAHQDQQKAVEKALAADREAALRDVFAAAALSGYIACDPKDVCRNDGSRFGRPITADDLAQLAYEQADAMLAARKC
jgi:hypothetical protein